MGRQHPSHDEASVRRTGEIRLSNGYLYLYLLRPDDTALVVAVACGARTAGNGIAVGSEATSKQVNTFLAADGKLYHHTHALFSFKKDGQHGMAGGHLKATTVLYTAEIELRPTVGGAISRKFDPETGTGFWNF